MVSLIDYRGLQVVSPDPTGDGGLAIQDNFKSLVDWNPKGVWAQSASPTSTDDNTLEYFPGSLWLQTNTTPSQLFVCKSSATAAASWLPILLNVVQDTSPKLGGDLDVNAFKIKDASSVTISVAGNSVATVTPSTIQIQGNTLIGTTTTPSGATFNIAVGGGSTSPVLGAATPDIVSLAAVDKTAGDRRLYIQSETGSPISIGNDRLNFAATSGNFSVGGTDVISIGGSGIGVGGVVASASACITAAIASSATSYGCNVIASLTATAATPQAGIGVIGTARAVSNFDYTALSGGVIGVKGVGSNYGVTSATITRMIGVAGTINTITGSTGTISNGNAFYAQSPTVNAGTVSVAAGLYIAQQKVTGVTTGYGIYQADAGDKNYFSGRTGFGSMTTPVYPVHAQGSSSGNAVFVDRVGTGAGNGQLWAIGIGNSAATDIFAFGCSSSTYTTGGNLAWLGNSECYLYFPSANGFKIGTTIGAGGAILTFSSTSLAVGVKFSKYNAIATAAGGVPAIYGYGRSTAQAAAVASVATYTVGTADASFLVWSNVLVTASTSHNFSVTCTYTDESNTSRTLTMTFSNSGGTLATAITNTSGAGPYSSVQAPIRAKAGTTITLSTTGTFTTVTYNIEGFIAQVS